MFPLARPLHLASSLPANTGPHCSTGRPEGFDTGRFSPSRTMGSLYTCTPNGQCELRPVSRNIAYAVRAASITRASVRSLEIARPGSRLPGTCYLLTHAVFIAPRRNSTVMGTNTSRFFATGILTARFLDSLAHRTYGYLENPPRGRPSCLATSAAWPRAATLRPRGGETMY